MAVGLHEGVIEFSSPGSASRIISCICLTGSQFCALSGTDERQILTSQREVRKRVQIDVKSKKSN